MMPVAAPIPNQVLAYPGNVTACLQAATKAVVVGSSCCARAGALMATDASAKAMKPMRDDVFFVPETIEAKAFVFDGVSFGDDCATVIVDYDRHFPVS